VVGLLERRLGDHDTALDLAQETWVRVFRALPRYDAERSFRSWLFAIALNAARDEHRRRRRSPVEFVDVPVATTDADSERSDHTQAVERALLGVAEPYRSALLLVDVEGLGYEEAAHSAGCAVGTMKSRVARGREAFRQTWSRVTGETGRARSTR
jgi:RNA polymerase sigma-70 factor, ECF subfamily